MEKILVIEDERAIAELIIYSLKKEGFEAEMANTGAEGIEKVNKMKPDLLLLDWMLPDCSGVDLCKMITEEFNIPIIMLTARANMDDKIQGLEYGADDYITKPFEIREVIVRIKTILRRVKKANKTIIEDIDLIIIKDISISKNDMIVKKNGEVIDITPKEYELLLYLNSHPNKVFTREILLEQIWGYEYMGDTRTIDTHVQRLRKKLGLYDEIQTVFGVGYRYVSN